MTPTYRCNFDVVNYTSEILWHFVKEDGVNCFLDKILQADGKILLKKSPTRERYHKRKITITHKGIDGKEYKNEFLFNEPKALCFADIPINFLPMHMKKYNSLLGIGISKEVSRYKYNIRPVDYYPLTTPDDIHEYWLKFVKKYRCNKPRRGKPVLDKYTKIPSDVETFDEIYMEREWRMTEDLKIAVEDDVLCLIMVAKRKDYQRVIKNKHIKKLMKNGVSVLLLENLFPKAEGK